MQKDLSDSQNETRDKAHVGSFSRQEEDQLLTQSQEREINNFMQFLPQKILSQQPPGHQIDSNELQKSDILQKVVSDDADTILHTREDEDQNEALMKRKNIIFNSNIQQVVKNIEKSNFVNRNAPDQSNQKTNLQKIVTLDEISNQPPREQIINYNQCPKSRAGFKQRSKSVNIKENTGAVNLISQGDNIRNQLRQKYKIVSNAMKYAAHQRKQNQAKNRETEQQRVASLP